MEETLERPTTSPNNNNSNNDGTNNSNLSPFLQGMVDEQRQLQMNVGKAMDTLRKDYPYFLKRSPGKMDLYECVLLSKCRDGDGFVVSHPLAVPCSLFPAPLIFSFSLPTPTTEHFADYSIYHDSITLSASDGQIQLSKLSSYRKACGIIRTMFSLLYDTDRCVIQSRMMYDSTRSQIRVSFNARLVPKSAPLLGLGLYYNTRASSAVHVDGISVYSIDLSSTYTEDEVGNLTKNDGAGKIIEHRIEKLLVNGAPLQPPYFNSFGLEMLLSGQRHGTGSLAGAGAWSCEGFIVSSQ